jgi:hypothetical protein
VLVMVEHFSKWIELMLLPNKFNEGVVYAFLDQILNQFGAPIEVLMDQGKEFLGNFETSCE